MLPIVWNMVLSVIPVEPVSCGEPIILAIDCNDGLNFTPVMLMLKACDHVGRLKTMSKLRINVFHNFGEGGYVTVSQL